jgi:hypothetical protein
VEIHVYVLCHGTVQYLVQYRYSTVPARFPPCLLTPNTLQAESFSRLNTHIKRKQKV